MFIYATGNSICDTGNKCRIAFTIMIVLAICIVGSVLVWYSVQGKTCDNWSVLGYGGQNCDYRGKISQALVDCNTTYECACRESISYKITCLRLPPGDSYSPIFMGFGISVIIIGLICTGFATCYIKELVTY